MLAGLLITGVGLAILVGFGIWRQKKAVYGDEVYRFRCPACAQKLRYFARQEGHSVQCPRCGGATVLPPVENEKVL